MEELYSIRNLVENCLIKAKESDEFNYDGMGLIRDEDENGYAIKNSEGEKVSSIKADTSNTVQNLRNILIPKLGLSEIMNSYEGKKGSKSFNKEWEKFFFTVIKYDWLYGRDKNGNPHRYLLRKEPFTVNNSLAECKISICNSLVDAIKKGKSSDEYMQKIKEIPLIKYLPLACTEKCIRMNIQSLFNRLNKYDLNPETVFNLLIIIQEIFKKRMYIKTDSKRKIPVNLEFVFSISDVTNLEVLLKKIKDNTPYEMIALEITESTLTQYIETYFTLVNNEYEETKKEKWLSELKTINESIKDAIKQSGIGIEDFYILNEIPSTVQN